MNVLSLFDGISCGLVALKRIGVKVDKYYAAEIDKYAIQVSEKNHPEITRLGDVNNWKSWGIDFSKIDLILSGFPCQAWSVAGKQGGLTDERGRLGITSYEIFKHVQKKNPDVKFLFENVRMKKEHLDFFDDLLGVKHTMINSALVSAQNRVRCYWTNLGDKIGQPEDKGLLLKDIIEHGEVDRDKSYCVDANYFKGGPLKNYFEKSRRQIVFSGEDLRKERVLKAAKTLDDKSHTLLATMYKGSQSNGQTNVVFNYSSSGRGGGVVEDRTSEAKKAGTLTATGYTNRSFTGVIQINPNKSAGGKQSHIQDRVYLDTGKSIALTSSFASRLNVATEKEELFFVRKLTPIECERLQTLEDNYTEGISNTQRYKCLGNGWTVDVISHILKEIL